MASVQTYSLIVIFIGLLVALISTKKRPVYSFSVALLGLIVTGNVSSEAALHHAVNPVVISLILLLLISSVIERTQLLRRLSRFIIHNSFSQSYWRMFSVTALSSAFLNNTAVVASLLSGIANNNKHSTSKLLLPLSYAAILGGTITLIGTSTNLIVDSFLFQSSGESFALFDFLLFGIGATIVCGAGLYFLLPLLPDNKVKAIENKQYFIETVVSANSSLIGKSIEDNGLRNLGRLFLSEIVREGHLLAPVSPCEIVQQGDKLIFVGDIQAIDLLHQFDGLELFADCNGLLKSNLVEVVISNRSMLRGKSLKQVGFRALFDAAVVAVRRDSNELNSSLGQLELRAGDVLVLAAGSDFVNRKNLTKNFFFVSDIEMPKKLSSWQETLVPLSFVGGLMSVAAGWLPLLDALIAVFALFCLFKLVDLNGVKRKLPLDLWIIITTSLCLGNAIQEAGIQGFLAEHLIPVLPLNEPFYIIVFIYLITLLLTELITNNAAAALMFPIAFGLASSLGVPPVAIAMTVALGASASFISPYGYQTNLMIFNAGNYRIQDFARIGVFISLLYSLTVLSLIHLVYFQ